MSSTDVHCNDIHLIYNDVYTYWFICIDKYLLIVIIVSVN